CHFGPASIGTPSAADPGRHGILDRTDQPLGSPPCQSICDREVAAADSVSWFCLVISGSESRCPRDLGRNLIELTARSFSHVGPTLSSGWPAFSSKSVTS